MKALIVFISALIVSTITLASDDPYRLEQPSDIDLNQGSQAVKSLEIHQWVDGVCRVVDPSQPADAWTVISPATAFGGMPEGCPAVNDPKERQEIVETYTWLIKEVKKHYDRDRFRVVVVGGVDFNMMKLAHDNTYYDSGLTDDMGNGKSFKADFNTLGFQVGIDVILNSHWSLSFRRVDIAPGRQEHLKALITSDENYVVKNCSGANIPGMKVKWSGVYSCPRADQVWEASGDEILWVMTVNYRHHMFKDLDWEIRAGVSENIPEWETRIYNREGQSQPGEKLASFRSKRVPQYGPTVGFGVEGPVMGCFANILKTDPNRNSEVDFAYPGQGRWTFQFDCSAKIWSVFPWERPN
jgi:hypothetical protein